MPYNVIPQLERIRLATRLSTTLLFFHSTPWLKDTWCSDDVFFQGIDFKMPQYLPDLNEPYVDVALKDAHAPVPRTSTLQRGNFAPNPFLFGLGVMLLEVSFEAPLRSLQQPVDIHTGQEDRNTEFFRAKRVSKSASRPLGDRYTKIVRKCLSCDFGEGDDLNEIPLQEAVNCSVVHELDLLEKKLYEFSILMNESCILRGYQEEGLTPADRPCRVARVRLPERE
ncbi:hypothetical protein EPUS_04600 [Endocarpon pusillum Z07020]|uniref:DUF7580 domain-containing protein n=1 Tax=Endocarpon pusillum (strain Z07020 / HMAS-L-300199) TaxID=1263415 RepID=U1HXS0_ENDPU|nr:uncharacterized protein EPUS_04600 [Endocarpon pusillum Z07020]ERF75620.1 hypothetical protein EPUS_04600 [Endocarpon pusillum Z07020]